MQRLSLSSSVARCDHYKTLGLERSATQAQIDQAYLDSVRDFKVLIVDKQVSVDGRTKRGQGQVDNIVGLAGALHFGV